MNTKPFWLLATTIIFISTGFLVEAVQLNTQLSILHTYFSYLGLVLSVVTAIALTGEE